MCGGGCILDYHTCRSVNLVFHFSRPDDNFCLLMFLFASQAALSAEPKFLVTVISTLEMPTVRICFIRPLPEGGPF